MTIKRILIGLLILLFSFCLLLSPISVNALDSLNVSTDVTSGTTGDCNWSISGTALTIAGHGRMADYSSSKPAPWDISNITEIFISDGVQNIGNNAFYYGQDVTSISVGNSVESIGTDSFYGCRSLVSITLPESVKIIGYGAYGGCSELREIIVPDSVTEIGSEAFRWCMSLKKVTIGNHVSSIGNRAFEWCSSLESINIPSSVTCIGNAVFHECYSLNSIELPDSVTSIGTTCFANCNALTDLMIPDSLSIIERDFCSGCKNLENITIPNSVTEISESAFNGCTVLKIHAYDDSYARTYANQNNIPFVSLGKKSPATKQTGNIIYFDAISAGWNNCDNVGFYICTDSGYPLSMWGSKNTYGEETGNGVWRYDFDKHGISLNPFSRYTVIFYSNFGGRTNEVTLDTSCYGDTAYCDGTRSPNPANISQSLLVPIWKHQKIYINNLGDVDADGSITIIDATYIQRELLDIPIPFYMNKTIADTDGDGVFTIMDATAIQRHLSGLLSNTNIGYPINLN